MKKQITFSLFLLSFFLIAFTPKGKNDKSGFNVKDINKSLAKISDSLYAGKYEVTNLQYHYFENDIIKSKKTELLNIIKLDTLNWIDKQTYQEPMVEFYFRHPAFNNYPVVNISHDAANLFCEWLTEKYNADSKRNFKKVLFRLPSEDEWETAAKGEYKISKYPWGDRLTQNGKLMCNYKVIGDEFIKYDTLTKKIVIENNSNLDITNNLNNATDITAPVNSYFPNTYGLYNISGNVAEMIKEKGISCGGGWKNLGGDVQIKSRVHYEKSSTDLGFRYFMEIIEK